MNSNELGKLPVYGQFQFSDSGPSIPIQSLDEFVGLIPGTKDMSYDIQGAFATNSQRLFEDQTMGGLVNHNSGTPETSSDFGVLCTENDDVDKLSSFGATPALDNTTMAVWSAAPTNFEYVLLFFPEVIPWIICCLGWKTGVLIFLVSNKWPRHGQHIEHQSRKKITFIRFSIIFTFTIAIVESAVKELNKKVLSHTLPLGSIATISQDAPQFP